MSADRTCGSCRFWVLDGNDFGECWVHSPEKMVEAAGDPEVPTPGLLARITRAADSCVRYQFDEGVSDLYEE